MIEQIFDEFGDEVGLYDLCDYFIAKYPKDIFVKKPEEIVKIRKLMEKMLKKVNQKRKKTDDN